MTLRTPTLLVLAVAANAQQKPIPVATLFAPDHLVDVRIEMAKTDWDKLRHQTRLFAASLQKEPPKRPFTYFKANVVIDGHRVENVGVRKKGLIGSLDTARPSLKIKLDHDHKKAKVAGLSTLTFNNNRQDRTLMSQFLRLRICLTIMWLFPVESVLYLKQGVVIDGLVLPQDGGHPELL